MKFEFAAIFTKYTGKKNLKNNRLYLNIGVLFPVRQQEAQAAGTQSTTILIIAGNAWGGILL